MWKFVTPICCMGLFLASIIVLFTADHEWNCIHRVEPVWKTQLLIAAFIVGLIWIPIVAICRMCQLQTGLSAASFFKLTKPTDDWGHMD